MNRRKLAFAIIGSCLAAGVAGAWSMATTDDVQAQAQGYPPLFAGVDSQGAYSVNPQSRDPLFFVEFKAWWPALGIDQPRTAWEYVQRGMYRQDDLEDVEAAIRDYQQAERLNSHILLIHARLGTIHLERGLDLAKRGEISALDELDEAIHRYEEVIHEQPYRLGLRFKIGRAHHARYGLTGDEADANRAVVRYREELAMGPTHQPTLYQLAHLYRTMGRTADARQMMERYLAQTELHSDPYPYKILAARKFIRDL